MELVECATYLINEYVHENNEHIHLDSFQSDLIFEIINILTIQFEGSDIDLHLLHMAFNLYPYGRTCLRSPLLTDVTSTLEAIASKPQPTQRTPEWYIYRHQLITASAAYKALGTTAKLNELICSKCAPMVFYEYTCTDSPMHWGVKYEPVSIAYYECINKTRVREYGCLTHDTYPFLGASPDGINVLESSPLYGRMLEIKNPVSRVITGFPLSEYWIQCQLQMEVCNLDACDFLETKFNEYSKEEFDADGSFQVTESGNFKGIILQFLKNDKVHYEYPPFQCTLSEYEIWEQEKMTPDLTWIQTLYWKLEVVSSVIIRRNKAWFQSHLHSWIEAWNIIQHEKEGEWKSRLPKSKKNLNTPLSIIDEAPLY